MDLAGGWTGRTACALQSALRLSNESFAAHLGIGVRTVAAWHQKPAARPRPDMQQILDTALDQAPEQAKARFAVLAGITAYAGPASASPDAPEDAKAADAERRLAADPHIAAALDRLDEYAAWQPGTARRQVAARLAGLDVRDVQDRAGRRRRVDRRQIAEALGSYYASTGGSDHGRYAARVGTGAEVATSVLTRPGWLDLNCPLLTASDGLQLTDTAPDLGLALDEAAAGAAAQRLAETLASGVRLVDMPLYRLTDIDVAPGRIGGTAAITSFVRYALTLDLLEGELADALAAGLPAAPGSLPLRERYLPDIPAVLGTGGRLCAGGALALCAISRPASLLNGPADYLLLVQERSGQVVNAARQLAVIPKGFHQPMTDYRGDTRIGITLAREMEEELFGRQDIDNTITGPYAADPMHPSRLSKPMRWLLAEPGRLRIECTGFGLNLVSGNFEFASLIVIESEEFWDRYGGVVEASWESSALRRYSSRNAGTLAALAADVAWSNEGLFAFLQGLRRLGQVGGERVNLPYIEWDIRP